ncbi:hypothetical protein LTR10_013769 [Elasticomyces elasticus]|uniref:NADH dehydrogenase [ubiquinone] 1 alpha subcomplex subunit 1 n=1 Tax=Exophiala sideris TaxID=1016849 RepID=A0ABR0JHA7_9EURO|nr:hypothetical protein LTR10_013769 [Elasticomyces elasticus]KAK5033255.1 hypothetical protein LTS07_003556 [Exophiala sideris]KAK5042248.1 hypothetical protein LTR13_002054 [Exophiala sideris]KAK5063799.1 hypothetical protein LTR69_003564 [Exophiala sideris]KAK5185516.1 hypothetical protein LTR44_002505 [Eurotiomycetes sp. CCFEE 6388]
MASVAQPWLIHKFVDPIFAVGVGLSAAYLRIRREESERYPDQDSSLGGLWQKGVRMSRSYFGPEVQDGKKL